MKLVYLNGGAEDPTVQHIIFPTGEKHIRITGLDSVDQVVIFYNDTDIMKLAMAVDICRRAGVRVIKLVMPFVPYARQDRIAAEGDPLSIKIFADYINQMGFHTVFITDPHSDVTSALLERCVVQPQHKIAAQAVLMLEESPFVHEPIALVAPDFGAAKKIKALQAYLVETTGVEYPVIQCDKARSVHTGKLVGFKVVHGNPSGHHCLMVDDICDGGGTFLGLADALKENGAVEQSLFVTHGIFSKGTQILREKFSNVMCSDSFPSDPTVIKFPVGVKVGVKV